MALFWLPFGQCLFASRLSQQIICASNLLPCSLPMSFQIYFAFFGWLIHLFLLSLKEHHTKYSGLLSRHPPRKEVEGREIYELAYISFRWGIPLNLPYWAKNLFHNVRGCKHGITAIGGQKCDEWISSFRVLFSLSKSHKLFFRRHAHYTGTCAFWFDDCQFRMSCTLPR